MSGSVRLEGSPGERFGLELYGLIAAMGFSHAGLHRAYSRVCELLSSDPHSVIDFVPVPATGTNGLGLTARIRDDFGANLALTADDFGQKRLSTS